MFNIRPALLFCAASALLAGCKTNEEMMARYEEENLALRGELTMKDDAISSLEGQLMNCESMSADLEEQLASASFTPTDDGLDPFGGLAGVTTEYEAGGVVTANVEGDFLFSSGRSTLKSSAKSSLNGVADQLKGEFAGQTIRIVGHTDTDPIKKSGHKSNHHLGFERAYAVMKYLVSRGVPESSIEVCSYGPNDPKSSKSTSRRVEISVVTD